MTAKRVAMVLRLSVVNTEAGIVDFVLYLLFDFKLQWNQSINVRRIDLSYANNDNRQPYFSRYIRNVILHIEHAFGTRTKYYYWFLTDISCSLRRFFFILSNNNPFQKWTKQMMFLNLMCIVPLFITHSLLQNTAFVNFNIIIFAYAHTFSYGCRWIKRFIY